MNNKITITRAACLFNGWYRRWMALFIFFLTCFPAMASGVLGLSITYRSLDINQVEITLTRYRQCSSIALSEDSIRMNLHGGSVNQDFWVYRTAIEDITPLCKNDTSPCNPANTMTAGKGVERHMYKGIVDFSLAPYNSFNAPGICEVFFSVKDNRAPATTIAPADIYAEAMMNRCLAPGNSSPVFAMDPVFYTPLNAGYRTAQLAVDTLDLNDSLMYYLIPARSDSATEVVYNTGYNYNKSPIDCYRLLGNPNLVIVSHDPPIGFYLDSFNGDMGTTPIGADQHAPVVVGVKEWRTDSSGARKLIGSMMREFMMIAESRPGNNLPRIGGPYNYVAMEGQSLCFTIPATDRPFILPPPAPIPPADTLTVAWWSHNMPDSLFTILNPDAPNKMVQFCWSPPEGTARPYPYYFAFKATDNNCTLPIGIASQAFRVSVYPKPKTHMEYQRIACGKYRVTSTPENNNYQYNYAWRVTDTAGQVLTTGSGKQTVLAIDYTGKVYLYHTITNSAASVATNTYTDSLVLDPCPFNRTLFRGRVYLDADSNCAQDAADTGIYDRQVFFESAQGHYSLYTDSQGYFEGLLPCDTYTVNLKLPPYLHTICPDSFSYTVVLDKDTLPDSLVFGIQVNPGAWDIKLALTGSGGYNVSQGETEFYRLAVTNMGGRPLSSAQVTLTLDAQLTAFSPGVPYHTKTGNIVTWNVPVLQPGESFLIPFTAQVPVAVPLGSNIVNTAELDALSSMGDTDPSDNQVELKQQVVVSVASTDKQSDISQFVKFYNRQVTYMIRFRNTGTAPVNSITITDTLDNGLDIDSLQMLNASHPYHMDVTGKVITWTFNHINLPDSAGNAQGSQGFVRFAVAPRSNLADSATIRNSAGIYLDTMPAVITNTVSVEYIIPRLELLTPAGEEELMQQQQYMITWKDYAVDMVKLEFSPDMGQNWQTIANNLPAAGKSYMWTVPAVNTEEGLIRISDAVYPEVNAVSLAPFAISDTSVRWVRLLYPVTPVTWYMGTSSIHWTSLNIDEVFVELSVDSGQTWRLLAEHIPASAGLLGVQVPIVNSHGCLARVSSQKNPLFYSQSPVYFTIASYQPLGVLPVKGSPVLQAYPNPACTEVYLNNLTQETFTVHITDMSGRQLQTLVLSPGILQQMDVSQWSNGLYLLHTPYAQYKLMIQH